MTHAPNRHFRDADDLLISDIINNTDLETEHMPEARVLRREAQREYRRIGQHEQLLQVVPEPPPPGVSLHIIGTGLYDFWTFVPQIISWIGAADELYVSTWTLNRTNAVEMFGLWDAGKIAPGRVGFLTGEYFKRRETAVYTYLVDGIRQRGGRYRAFMNHAKVLLLCNAAQGAFLVCEGSANLTANPRLEQFVLTNERRLYEFHKGWMEESLNA